MLKKTIQFVKDFISNLTPNMVVRILLAFVILALPYGMRFLPILLSTLFIVWFISLFIPKRTEGVNLKQIKLYLLPLLGVISLISLTYSENISMGTKVLERMISFAILPFLFYTEGKKPIKNSIETLFLLLGTSILISIIILLINFQLKIGFEKISGIPSLSKIIIQFRYFMVVHSLGLHPSYYSYLILIFLLYPIFRLRKHHKFKRLFIILGGVSILSIIFFNSRGALLTLMFLIAYGLIKQLYRKRYFLFGTIVAISILAGYISYNHTRLGNTLKEITEKKEGQKKDERLILWKNAINKGMQNPIFGYGIGDALNELIEEHRRQEDYGAATKRLDAHNQFLETWLQSGVFGLVSLLLVFALPLYQSLRKKQELLFLFLMISFIQLLFESMFIRLAGVVYFSFFYSYLYYVYYYPGGEWDTFRTTSLSNINER